MLGWEFVLASPKTYELQSHSGQKNIMKSKGFSLHYSNQQMLNFELLKEQVLLKEFYKDIVHLSREETCKQHKLTLHCNKIII